LDKFKIITNKYFMTERKSASHKRDSKGRIVDNKHETLNVKRSERISRTSIIMSIAIVAFAITGMLLGVSMNGTREARAQVDVLNRQLAARVEVVNKDAALDSSSPSASQNDKLEEVKKTVVETGEEIVAEEDEA
jgi:hypothetical protein